MLNFLSNKLDLLPVGIAAKEDRRYTAAVTIRDSYYKNEFTITKAELPIFIEQLTSSMNEAIEMYDEMSAR